MSVRRGDPRIARGSASRGLAEHGGDGAADEDGLEHRADKGLDEKPPDFGAKKPHACPAHLKKTVQMVP